MGSISKLFTSTAAMQLAQQGQLDIDAPVQTALPGFRVQSPVGQPAITPRLLMTHHAGLTRDVGNGMWGSQVGRFQDMVQGLEPAAQIYPPGLLLSYSNVGMTVLGAAVEQVARTPFETHIQRTLLEPLGMATASFTQAAGPEVARAHKAGKVVNEPALRDTPAGALNASVLDMSRFMMMVFANGKAPGGQTILEPAQLAEMLTAQNAGNALDFDLRIGLGWMLNSIGPDALRGAGPVIHHGGATVNFHSQMYLLPQHKLADRVAKRALGMVLAAKTGIQQLPQEPPFVPASTPWADEQLQAWEGDYATVLGHARVVREGKQLKAHAGDRVLDLIPGDNGGMGLSYKVLGMFTLPINELQQVTLLRRQVEGRDVLIARLGGQEILIGERLTVRPDARAAQWLGRYVPLDKINGEEPVERITLSLDHDVLLARVRMTEIEGGAEEVLPIRLVSEREARVLRPLADFGEAVHWREVNGRPGFEVSGIVFVRSSS
jgi:CubicO group peptidase (beta-lactamase class C family)